jgi:redox-sensitive bicupin YhaK (pirin superfamily)
MSQSRKIQTVWKSRPTLEGAGVHLRRAFGNAQVPRFDPFLLMDDFRSDDPAKYLAGFPWHPHRGIETITYVLDGNVEHGDSLGNRGVIAAGDVQWMTAGSGIIHQEMPKGGPDQRMGGFQLWANLPAMKKMMGPRYREVKTGEIPAVRDPSGATVRVVSGSLGGVDGPVQDIVIEPEYLDVSIPAGATFVHPVKPGHTVFAYVISGEGFFDRKRESEGFEVAGTPAGGPPPDRLIESESLVLYDRGGEEVEMTAVGAPLRFLLVSGKPIGEPVAWYGPIVMNTQQEIRVAFEEYQNGTFIKKEAKQD